MPEIVFGHALAPLRIGAQDVFVREQWDADWEWIEHLHCDHCVWSAAPSEPTAMLSWIYGRLARERTLAWETALKLTGRLRFFVKCDFQLRLDPDTGFFTKRQWYGLLELDEDFLGGGLIRADKDGAKTTTAVGEQHLVCYGLERLLAEHTVDYSYWRDDDGEPKRIERAIAFNADGQPNCSPAKFDGVYHFGTDRQTVKHWTTHDIVEYLLKYHTPRNKANLPVVEFRLRPIFPSPLPDWDEPVLEAQGVRTLELLDQLIPRQRLLGWYLEVTNANRVDLVPFTFTEADIGVLVAGGRPIPANKNQLSLNFEADVSADVAVKRSAIDACDQVIVRGARRRSCFTVSFADGTLARGWTPAEETSYRAGASGDAAYPAAEEIMERQERNAEARALWTRVYARFELDAGWDLRAGDGEGADEGGKQPVFPVPGAAADPFPIYRLDMEIEPTTPLIMGVDYAADKVKLGTVDETTAFGYREELPLFVAWKLPETDPVRWLAVEQLGALADIEETEDEDNHAFSVSVHVVPHSRSFELHVHGQPQHAIAGFDFTPLEEDEDLGKHDFRKMAVTLSVRDDRYCEGRWPEDKDLPAGRSALKRYLINAGPGYKQDYLVPQTVVAIDTSGELVRSSGGYLRDDSPLLKATAKVALSWYGRPRGVLSLRSGQLNEELFLGQLVLDVGDPAAAGGHHDTLNTVVTQVELAWPRSVDSRPQPPTMTWTTQAGELDPLRLMGPGGPVRGEVPVVLPRRDLPKL
jgi:hypothetical protein